MGSHPWMFPQWGLISKAGIPKPSYRAFELLNKAGPLRFPVAISDHPAASSVSVFATAEYDDGADLQMFISNMLPVQFGRNCTAVDINISVAVNSTSTMDVPHALVTIIDAEHANPVETWEERGSPLVLNREDTAALMDASIPAKYVVNVTHGQRAHGQRALGLRLTLPPTSVVHVAFGEW